MTLKPFLRWAGGKQLLLPQILPFLDSAEGSWRYFEPFLGGGALFFALLPRRATLSDVNPELIETYASVRDDVEGVVAKLKRMNYSTIDYYATRRSRPRSPSGRAARFIFLNKTCFNGLYRVNSSGEFNVPVGQPKNPPIICDEGLLRAASLALKRSTISCCDFEDAVKNIRSGDAVYFDPPYITSHQTNGFVEYNERIFSWDDQVRLAKLAHELTDIGVRVLISNGDHASIRNLYRESSRFEIRRIRRWSTIAANPGKRNPATEIVIANRP